MAKAHETQYFHRQLTVCSHSKTAMEREVLRAFNTKLIDQLESCVKPVADGCFEKQLITQSTYTEISLFPDYRRKENARTLVVEITKRTQSNYSCFQKFCDILVIKTLLMS